MALHGCWLHNQRFSGKILGCFHWPLPGIEPQCNLLHCYPFGYRGDHECGAVLWSITQCLQLDCETGIQSSCTCCRSSQDSCLFLVRDHDPQALSKSFDELNLFEEQTEDIITVSADFIAPVTERCHCSQVSMPRDFLVKASLL